MGIEQQAQELVWGAFVLDSEAVPDLPWKCETMAAGSDLGNPVPVVEEVASMLADGDLSTVTSYGNREIVFRIRISAHDGESLAQGASALLAEALKTLPSPLHYTPKIRGAWTCAFDVVTAKIEGDYSDGWDVDEAYEHSRYYVVSWNCLPWAHDLESTVIPALPAPEDPETPENYQVIDTCDSNQNWARSVSPTTGWTGLSGPVAAGGAVRVSGTRANGFGSGEAWLTVELRNLAVDMSATPFLVVDVDATSDAIVTLGPGITVRYDDGTPVQPAAIKPHPSAAGRYLFYFDAPVSFAKVKVRARFTELSPSAKYLHVYEIGRTDRVTSGTSKGFQVARTAVVGGSARTQAEIRAISDEGPLLNSTGLIYTGATPGIALRPLLVSSAAPVTDDAAMVSGKRNTLASETVALVPVNQLAHANYALLVKLGALGTFTVSWSAKIVDAAGADIPGSEIVESGSMLCTNNTGDGHMIHEIGDIPMPIVAIEGSTTHCVKVTISMSSGGAAVAFDDGWLLDTDNGDVTVFHQPTAYDLTAVELQSPRLDAPRQAVIATWGSHGAQDVITRGDIVTRIGTHNLKPGPLNILTVFDGKRWPAVELEFYRAHHTHPGPDYDHGTDEAA